MKRFNINDKVVALVSSQKDINDVQVLVKGKVYLVTDIKYCSRCGEQHVNIDNSTCSYFDYICDCGEYVLSKGLGYTEAEYFCKVDDIDLEIEEALMIEDYDKAILLRDLKNS